MRHKYLLWIVYLGLLCSYGIIYYVAGEGYPMDLGFYVSKSLETLLFYLNNGIQIQKWSPAFGGGVPSIPNP